MSDFFWKKLTLLSGYAAIAVFFGLTAFAANLEIKDLDLWLHIKTGQYIVEHQTVPTTDVLSCSITGKPWNNHEWLFQVILYLVHQQSGFDGLITMQVVVVSLTFLILLLLTYRPDRQWLAVSTLILALLVYQSRFTIRPDIFSLLFFAINMYILVRHLDKRWSLWVLAGVQLLWVNMHGFSIFGPVLILLAIAAEGVKRRVPLPYEWNTIGRLSDDEFKRLWQILGVLLLVCLINPMGLEGALYPFKVLFQAAGESKVFFQNIYELQKPFANGLALAEHTHYKVLIGASLLSFFFNRRRLDLSVFFLWLVFLLFSLVAIRNMVFFACTSYLVIMINSLSIKLDEILPLKFAQNKFKEVTVIVIHVLLILWMLDYGNLLAGRGYFDYDKYERKSEYGGVSKRSFAYQAADFLVANNIRGNFFNDFNSGAYLIGRTHPNIKVFIDGRTEVYGSRFFKKYQQIWKYGSKKAFNDEATKCRFTGAFLNGANQRIPPRVIRLFYGMKDWKLVYFNHDGMIFLKTIPENQAIIAKYAIDLTKWTPPVMDLPRLGSVRIYPFPYIDRARILMALKLDEPALKELKIALKISPDAAEIYQMLGDIYGRQKQYRKSFEHFRIATMLFPTDPHNRKGLAWAYGQIGDKKNSLKHYERLLADNPDDARIAAQVKKLRAALTEK